MGGLLNEYTNNGSGYDDDLKLVTLSMKTLKILAIVCELYADKCAVLFV